jgi:hypothetical protein
MKVFRLVKKAELEVGGDVMDPTVRKKARADTCEYY